MKTKPGALSHLKVRGLCGLTCLSISLLLLPMDGFAQTEVNPASGIQLAQSAGVSIPPAQQPGAILDTRTNPIKNSPSQTVPSEQQPENIGLPEAPTTPPSNPQEGVLPELPQSVQVDSIVIRRTTLFPPKAFRHITQAFEGRALTYKELQELTRKISQFYWDHGYKTSFAYLPAQQIDKGVIQIDVLEGKIGKVTLQEGRYFKSRAIRPRINGLDNAPFEKKPYAKPAPQTSAEAGSGEVSSSIDPPPINLDFEPSSTEGSSAETPSPELLADAPVYFNVRDVQTSLYHINQNRDVQVYTELSPGDTPGTTDVTLKVQDKLPIHVTPFWDNLGRSQIGNNRYGVALEHNNLLGFGDQLYSNNSFTRRSFGTFNRYELPVGPWGTRLGMDAAYSTLSLGEELASLDIDAEALTLSPHLTQPVFTRSNWQLVSDLAFDFKEIDTDVANQAFSRDSLRILRGGLTLTHNDKTGYTYFRNEIAFGLDIFGATDGNGPLASRNQAGSHFFRYIGNIQRQQNLFWSTFAVLKGSVQLTPDRLVAAEQMQLGGAYSVRGYREGAYIGDKGYQLSAEWHVPAFVFPRTWRIPGTQYTLRDNIWFVTFIDYGSVFTNRADNGVSRSEHAMGVGGGIRARLTKYLQVRLDLGIPMLRHTPYGQQPKLHFGLQSELF